MVIAIGTLIPFNTCSHVSGPRTSLGVTHGVLLIRQSLLSTVDLNYYDCFTDLSTSNWQFKQSLKNKTCKELIMKVNNTNSSKVCQTLNIVLQQWTTQELNWNENHLLSRQQKLENDLDITGSTSGNRSMLLRISRQETVDHVSNLLTGLDNETPADFASQVQV